MDILLIEDSAAHAVLIERVLGRARHGWRVRRAATGRQGLAALEASPVDIVLLDFSLPDLDGMEVLRRIRARDPEVPVVFVTATDSVRVGVEAMKEGANEYIVKHRNYLEALPAALDEVLERVRLRRSHEELQARVSRQEEELSRLRRQLGSPAGFAAIIGASPQMETVKGLARRAIDSSVNVLLEGETGTGKELIARTIHFHGPRRRRLFAPVNCAAIPEPLLESEFFGHTRGAFTGAHRDKKGLFEEADGGTIFLDEVEDLPMALQAKLLRVLQDREFRALGSNRYRRFDVRIIAATNHDLEELVAEGRFRKDLFFRLNVFPIRLPPLREHKEDLPALVRHFVAAYNGRHGTSFPPPSAAVLRPLFAYSWPGNVRELENVLERVLVTSDGSQINTAELAAILRDREPGDERSRIVGALERNRWSRARAARELGLSRVTLWRKMVRHGLTGAR